MKPFNHFLFILALGLGYISSSKAEAEEASKSTFNSIYCQTPLNLYEQNSLWSSDEFIEASREEKNKMLLNHFTQQRAAAYISTFKESGLKLLPIFPAMWALYRYRHLYTGIPTWMGFGGVIGSMRFLEYPVSGLASNIRDFADVFVKLYLSKAQELSRLEKLELEYVLNKIEIPEEYQAILEDRLVKAYCPNGGKVFSSEYDAKGNEKVLATILKLPREIKNISYNRKKVDSILQGYAGDTLQNLKRYCIRHVAACHSESVRKIAAYFHGIPGVGKTRAAKLIAKAVDVPLEIISLADITIDKLVGTYNTPGLLLTALTHSKYQNMLLLIDEADRVLLDDSRTELLSFILTLLDSETKSFYSPFLETEVDISHLGIILTGNSEITDAALKNRLHVIEFEGYVSEYKKLVLWQEFFPEQLAIYEKAEFSLTTDDFTQADRDAINKIVDEDKDAGFRSIKLKLMNYFEDKVLLKYFSDDSDNLNLDKDEHAYTIQVY